MLCLSALRIIFVRILFAVCVSDGGFMFLKLDSVSVVMLGMCLLLYLLAVYTSVPYSQTLNNVISMTQHMYSLWLFMIVCGKCFAIAVVTWCGFELFSLYVVVMTYIALRTSLVCHWQRRTAVLQLRCISI